MAEGKVRRRAQDWRVLIGEWQESGIDLVEFCRERRIAPSSLRWWRWRLGGSSEGRQASTALSAIARPTRKGNNWIQLKIESSASPRSPFELRWPSGTILAIPADFDSEALGRLIAVMERSPC